MKKYYNSLFLASLILARPVYSQSTITFDDLTGSGFNSLPPIFVPNGYQGFNWDNMIVANSTGFPLSGFMNGTVSPNNVAVGCYLAPSSFSASSPFILVSGDFTSAFQNGMSLEITGLNATRTVFDETFTLNVYGPSFLTFPPSPVTQVDFAASGGAFVIGYLAGNPEVVVDNLTVAPVPEPSSALLVAVGLGGMGFLRSRRIT